MWITGTTVEVLHCQHCSKPEVWWMEREPGKAPILAFKGFPKDGSIIMSKNKVGVICMKCQDGFILGDSEIIRVS
jgi:hypothetical protein